MFLLFFSVQLSCFVGIQEEHIMTNVTILIAWELMVTTTNLYPEGVPLDSGLNHKFQVTI